MKKIILAFLTILLPLGISAQDYNKYLEAAQKHLNNGNYAKAEVAYNVYKQLSGKSDINIETSLKNTQATSINPHNSGSPIKLDLSIESSTPFFCMDDYGGGNLRKKNPKYRIGNDTLGGVSVYINLIEGKYDQLIRIESNKKSENRLIGNISTGDAITIISDNPSFERYSTIVTDSIITKQYLCAKIKKKRISFSGKVIDKYTREGVANAIVVLYYVDNGDFVPLHQSKYERSICKTNTTNGSFGFSNCISDYSYHIENRCTSRLL